MVINQLLADILRDLMEVCKEKNFYKELNIMETMYKSHSHLLVEEAEAKAEKRRNLEIAKIFLDDFDNETLSIKIGLPLAEIEQLRANS